MLHLIHSAPIVSSGTLRPDHLCSALLAEADRLGVELPRDLWQPAAAIAAHGQYGGVCLDLPPRLAEISGDVVAELIDTLNWHAPDGCHLGYSEGDGALLLWHLSLAAQAAAINADPRSGWEAKTLELPAHWIVAIVNGDETGFDYYDDAEDYVAYRRFTDAELTGWSIAETADEPSFSPWHDATAYGVLPCDSVEVLLMRRRTNAAEPS